MTTAPPTSTTVPAAPQPETCANCGAPLYGRYCYACGQPTIGLVRHFGSVMGDVVDSIFNVDERLFKTIGPLYLRPGKLTLDYFAGRRARYVTPFRLVFFLAIIAFFAIQLSMRSGYGHLATQSIVLSAGANGTSVSMAPTPKAAAPISSDDEAFAHGNISFNDKVLWNRASKPFAVDWLPGVAVAWLNDLIANAQEQLHAMNAGSWADQQAARRKFTLGMFSAAPTVLFILLPAFALLLKVFYLFKRRLYMEHLIVAMHSHAFLMLSMLVVLALNLAHGWMVGYVHWLGVLLQWLHAAAWAWVFVYLWWMQKRVYRQGWFMTTWKYCWIGFCYSILAGCGFVFAVLISLTGA